MLRLLGCFVASQNGDGSSAGTGTCSEVQILRKAVDAFITKHNPDKLSMLEGAFEHFRGREHKLVQKLEKKYNEKVDLAAFSDIECESEAQPALLADFPVGTGTVRPFGTN